MKLSYYLRSCLVAIFATMAQMGFFSSCQDYDPHIPLKSYDEMLKSDEIWNFSMTRDINIDLDLGLRGVTYPVSVYAEYPYDEDGELLDGIEPFFAFFTSDGRYKADVELPSVYNKLYFACGGIGVPSLIVGNVVNGHVEFGEALTRANVDLYEYSITDNGTTLTPAQYSIKKWGVESTDPLYFSRFGIDNNNSNPNFVNTLYTLYPWAVNGAPLAGTDDYDAINGPVEKGATNIDYDYKVYYTDESTAVQTNNGTPEQWMTFVGFDSGAQVATHKIYYYTNNSGSLLTVETSVSGMLKLSATTSSTFKYKVGDDSEISVDDGNSIIEIPLSVAGTPEYPETFVVSRTHGSIQITRIEFDPEQGDNTVVEIDPTDKNVPAAVSPFVFTGKMGSNSEDCSATFAGNEYKYSLNLRNKDTKLYFTVPSYTTADLILVFCEKENADFKCNDVQYADIVGNIRTITLTEGNYTITGFTGRHLLYAELKYKNSYSDQVTTHTRTSQVYKYNNIKSEISTLYQDITNTLWHGFGSKQLAKKGGDPSAKPDKYPYFNSEYAQADQSKNNITTLEDESEVYVTFLAEFNSYSANSVGYYYYKKGEAPSNPNNLKKYLMFPNCSSDLYSTAKKYEGHRNITPLRTGDQIQLMYFDESTQQYTTKFPKDIVIGWFLIYSGFNGWDVKNDKADNMLDGTINLGVYNNGIQQARDNDYKNYLSQVYYSDPNFNNSGIARVIQFTEDEKTIALCFEDSYNGYQTGENTRVYDDLTYDDLILAVSSNKRLHNNSDQDIIKQIDGQISYAENGTFLFEDILNGNKTDFDMNDVVVEYNRQYTLNVPGESVNGQGYTAPAYLTKTIENYKVINDGATYQDAFIVKTPYSTDNVERVSVTAYGANGSSFYSETWNNFTQGENKFTSDQKISIQQPSYEVGSDKLISFVLFDDINYIDMNVSYKFEITFNANYCPNNAVGSVTDSGIATLTKGNPISRADYDPFVVVRDHPAASGKRCEIHKPGKTFTAYGENIFINNGALAESINNYWYVAKFENKCLPFALDITATGFKVCENTTPINSVYSKFDTWAASSKDGGSASADWYMTPGNGVAASYPTDR